MKSKNFFLVIISLLLMGASSPGIVQFNHPSINLLAPSSTATADELIYFTNLARTQYGLQALTVNSILMSTAQATAETMAANQSSWHIGGVQQRVMDAGYGGGVIAWATENFAVGDSTTTAEFIVNVMWNDDTHNIPVMNPIYCDIGAGVAADSEGNVYFIVHAAYSNNHACGPYIAPDGTTLETLYPSENGDSGEEAEGTEESSQWMQPVVRVTPNEEGYYIHEVQYGQTMWSIAIEYQTTIKEINNYNGLSEDNEIVWAGQQLYIPPPLTPWPTETLAATFSYTIPPSTPVPTNTLQPINTNTIAPVVQSTPSNTPEQIEQRSSSRSFSNLMIWLLGLGAGLVVLNFVLKKSRPMN